jgi:hypothetical protein
MIGSSLGLLAMLGCPSSAPIEKPATIEGVSQAITFDSVSRLGPHFSSSSIHRQEHRGGELTAESTESIEIAWNNPESFHFQRHVDGELSFEAIVHEGLSASREGRGPWREEFDGERARMDVYTAWNAWDEALAGFRERIGFDEAGSSVIDGRPAQRFQVILVPLPEPSGRKRTSKRMLPHALKGEVVLDKATAVRLRADVTATEVQGDIRKWTQLKITRSGIGELQGIEPPQAQLGTAGDLLKKMPQRPKSQ